MNLSKRTSSSGLTTRWTAIAFLLCEILTAPFTNGGLCPSRPGAAQAIGKTPLNANVPPSVFFVANEGQWDEPFAFKMEAGSTTYYVTKSGLTIDIRQYDRPVHASRFDELDPLDHHREPEPVSVRGHVLKMNFVSSSPEQGLLTLPESSFHGEDKLASYSNYFIGRDSCNWRSRVGHYQRVILEEGWSGIDVEFRAQPNGIETVYHVKPGADPSQIVIEYEGLDAPLRTDAHGNLILSTTLGNLTEKAPWAYQIINNRQQEVPIDFQVIGDNRCTLNPEAFDQGKVLVIDPLIYSSYFTAGISTNDFIADSTGNLLQVGGTFNPIFPTTEGAYQDTLLGPRDWFVTKWEPNGHNFIFSTYIGGGQTQSDGEYAEGVAIDIDGRIYIGGTTDSPDFPLTTGAIDTVYGGANWEAVICVLTPDGSELDYSSFWGGDGRERVSDVQFDVETNLLYMLGSTGDASTFQYTPDALFDATDASRGLFITVFSLTENQIAYSTLFPSTMGASIVPFDLEIIEPGLVVISGSSYEPGGLPLSPDAFDTVCAGGQDGFFARLNFNIPQVEYCSYLGGSQTESLCLFTVMDSAHILLSGRTRSPDFPVTANAADTMFRGNSEGFVTILEFPSTLQASTLVGGSEQDWVLNVLKAPNGDWITGGSTTSPDFFVTPDAYDTVLNNNGVGGDFYDAMVCVLSADLSQIRYSTFVGGFEIDYGGRIILTGDNTIWMGGHTRSEDFPVSADAYRSELPGWESEYLMHLDMGIEFSAEDRRRISLPSLSLLVYPNPFNSTTTLSYWLPKSSSISLTVHDLLGRQVFQISNHLTLPGAHSILFDASGLSSGHYYTQITAGDQSIVKRLIHIK